MDRSAEWCSTPEGFAFYEVYFTDRTRENTARRIGQSCGEWFESIDEAYLLFFCLARDESVRHEPKSSSLGDWMSRYPDLYELGEKHLDVTRHFASVAVCSLVSRKSKAKMARHERLCAALLLDKLLRGEDTNVIGSKMVGADERRRGSRQD